jgi:hypothetical protein
MVETGDLNKKSTHFQNGFLAGATGIAPCASKFGGTDFQARFELERLWKRAFRRDLCFLKGFFVC